MKTVFLLMAQYDGRAIIPIDRVCADFFTHMTPQQLIHKVDRGEVKLPLVRIEASQKAARGVHLNDLAKWINDRRDAAERELKSLTG